MSLVTTAGEMGSLIPQEDCVIGFDSARPLVWDIPVPISDGMNGGSVLSDCGYNACEFSISTKKSKTSKKAKEPKMAKNKKTAKGK